MKESTLSMVRSFSSLRKQTLKCPTSASRQLMKSAIRSTLRVKVQSMLVVPSENHWQTSRLNLKVVWYQFWSARQTIKTSTALIVSVSFWIRDKRHQLISSCRGISEDSWHFLSSASRQCQSTWHLGSGSNFCMRRSLCMTWMVLTLIQRKFFVTCSSTLRIWVTKTSNTVSIKISRQFFHAAMKFHSALMVKISRLPRLTSESSSKKCLKFVQKKLPNKLKLSVKVS